VVGGGRPRNEHDPDQRGGDTGELKAGRGRAADEGGDHGEHAGAGGDRRDHRHRALGQGTVEGEQGATPEHSPDGAEGQRAQGGRLPLGEHGRQHQQPAGELAPQRHRQGRQVARLHAAEEVGRAPEQAGAQTQGDRERHGPTLLPGRFTIMTFESTEV